MMSAIQEEPSLSAKLPQNELTSYTYKSGAVYVGTFEGTKRHGRGRWQHPGGEQYEGEYVNNKQDGLGVYRFTASGKCYIGHWKEGEMDGEGVYYFTPCRSTFYVGSYARDKKHGHGIYCYENGIVTVQIWDNGVLQKEDEATPLQRVECELKVQNIIEAVRPVAQTELGPLLSHSEIRTFQLPFGATYIGQFYGTKKHGVGYWKHSEGDSYEGQFEQNKHSGWGVYVVGRSGKKYVGHWHNGKMNGIGIYFFNRNETEYFVGSYKDDVKHGRGLYHFADSGHNKVQMWIDGVIKDEADAEEALVEEYRAAMLKIIDIVCGFAPHYQSLTVH